MKRFLAIVGAIIMLSSFSEAEAGHIWEATYHSFNYKIFQNGGEFIYSPSWYYNHDIGVSSGGECFSSPAVSTNEGFDETVPGSMSLNGMAGGNLSGDDTIVVRACAGIDYASELNEPNHFNTDHHAVQVHQNVLANIDKIFRVDTDGYCDVTASLAGLVNFDSFSTSDNLYARYELTGRVSLLEFREDIEGGVAGIVEFVLDNETRSGAIEGIPVFAPEVGNDIYYKMHAGLLLKTWVQNVDYTPPFKSFELDGPFQLGGDNPLVLTASMSTRTVPIPGTVFLLFSGLGGLTLMRRRFLRT